MQETKDLPRIGGMEVMPPSSSEEDRKSRQDNDDCSSSTGSFSEENHATVDKQDAMAYLLRYETMVRQQEAEDMAVIAHLRPCIQRLLELLGQETSVFDHKFLQAEISFEQLKLAYDILLQQQSEFMTTDRQFMMVLKLLTQKVDLKQTELNAAVPYITWAEVVQCYKTCVNGMLTLQHTAPAVKARARDRTLALLSLFEAPSTQLFHQDAIMGSGTILDTSSFARSRRNITRRMSSSKNRNQTLMLLGVVMAAVLVVVIHYSVAASGLVSGSMADSVALAPHYSKDSTSVAPITLQEKSDVSSKETHIKIQSDRAVMLSPKTQVVAKPTPAKSSVPAVSSVAAGPLVTMLKQVAVVPKRVMNLLKHVLEWISQRVQ